MRILYEIWTLFLWRFRWSFGILLWEIFSYGGTPYPTLSAEALLKALQLGIRNEQPAGSPSAVYNLMLSCWSLDPLARPGFSHLVAILQQVYEGTLKPRKQSYLDSSSPAMNSPDSFNLNSRSTSPSLSTVYLTLNNNNNNSNGILRAVEQWPNSEDSQIASPSANNVVLNNAFVDSGQYLQSVHKAFSLHCNYVVVSVDWWI